MGFIPFSRQVSWKCTAPNMLPWSVMAMAFMPEAHALVDQLVEPAGPVEEAVLGVQVEVDEVRLRAHSHSIVDGGLLLTSYTTRLMPRTSLTIRLEVRARRS